MIPASSHLAAKIRFTRVTVLTGLLLAGWHWWVAPLSQGFQTAFFVVGIFAFGIQHGALDHLIEEEVARRDETTFHLVSFLGKYTLLMVVYGLLWYWWPQLSFVLFLLISAWHFGETDINLRNQFSGVATKLVYGIAVLGWILLTHIDESNSTTAKMLPAGAPLYRLWMAAASHAVVPATLCGLVIVLIVATCQFKAGKSGGPLLYVHLLLILGCAALLPLLPAFALYFAGWHSLISLQNITLFMQENSLAKGGITLRKLWQKSLPLSLSAIAGLLMAGYYLRHHAPLFEPLPLLFVFLSLITLPHMSSMHQLNKRMIR